MLYSARKLQGFGINATDGAIGKLRDVYFDDERWTIRYLIVDTGGWLTGREVLISPISFDKLDWERQEMHIRLSRQQVEESPSIDTRQPISRQQEVELFRHYDYPLYWIGPLLWGFGALPPLGGISRLETEDSQATPLAASPEQAVDPAASHLRSAAEVMGYHIRATDDTIGHVEDFLFDPGDWSIRLLAVATRNWWPGKHVLISPQRIVSVSWADRHVFVNVTRDAIENSPEYDPANPPGDSDDLYRRSNEGGD